MGRVVLDSATVAEFLSATALFRNCERGVVDKIAPHLVATEYSPGEIIFRAGSPDQGLGIVFAGRVAVRQINAATGAALTMEEVRVGDSFGEVGAVMATVQANEIVAEDNSTILLVGKEVVAQLISKIAPFAQGLEAGASVGERLACWWQCHGSPWPERGPSPAPDGHSCNARRRHQIRTGVELSDQRQIDCDARAKNHSAATRVAAGIAWQDHGGRHGRSVQRCSPS